MSWHHIIPFPILRDVWNRLVDQHVGTALPDARVAIRQYLLLSNCNLPNLDAFVDRMRVENSDQEAFHSIIGWSSSAFQRRIYWPQRLYGPHGTL